MVVVVADDPAPWKSKSSCDIRYLLWLEVTQVVQGKSIIESPAALKSDKFGNST